MGWRLSIRKCSPVRGRFEAGRRRSSRNSTFARIPRLTSLSLADQAVIGRALSKNPNDRFPTCGEMIRALAGNVTDASQIPQQVPILGFEIEEPSPCPPEAGLCVSLARPVPSPHTRLHREATLFPDVSLGSATSMAADPSMPASEFVREELIEPTLFVGIGGLAAGVLAQIKHLFQSRAVQPGDQLPLGWLLLDTDRAAILRIRSPDLPAGLEADETVLMPLHGPEHYQAQWKQLLGWLGRHWLYRIPRSQCVEGIRALGRLALIDNAEDVMKRLRQAVRQVRSRIDDETARSRFQIVVVASISGGTGGGCLVDVGFAIRRILRDEGLEGIPVVSILIQASSARKERKELAHANAFVTLSELHSFLDTDCRFPGVKALGLSPLEGGSPLFDDVILASFGDLATDADSRTGEHLLAQYVHLLRGTPCGRLVTRQTSRVRQGVLPHPDPAVSPGQGRLPPVGAGARDRPRGLPADDPPMASGSAGPEWRRGGSPFPSPADVSR